MQITFERSGGFAGMRMSYSVDTEELPPEKAQAIKDLVEQVDFFNLPDVLPEEAALPDQFQYELTLETEAEKHTLKTTESGATAPVQALLRTLTLLARDLPDS